MPKEIIYKLYSKIKDNQKTAFFSTLIVGFIVYLYVITNRFQNHDGLDSLYHDQNLSSSGRFFLSYAAGISSYFELPIIIGTLSLIYLAIISALIVDIFDIKGKVEIIILSGLLVTFPTISATFSYLFTTDAYMLGYALAIISMYLIIKLDTAKYYSWIILFVSIGIYQATMSFYLIISILYILLKLLTSKGNISKVYREFLRLMVTFIMALGSYVVIFKIYQSFFKITNYQGLDQSGDISLYMIYQGVIKTITSFGGFYFVNMISYQSITLFEVLNILIFIIVFCTICLVLIKSKLKLIHKLFSIFLIGCIPFASFIIYFISPNASYHMLMMYGLIFIYISLLLCYYYIFTIKKYKFLSWVTVIGLLLVILNNSIIANIGFLNAEMKIERSKTFMNRVLTKVEMEKNVEDIKKIFLVGTINMDSDLTSNVIPSRTPNLTGTRGDHSLNDQDGIRNFLEIYYGYDLISASAEDLKEHDRYYIDEEMEAWPSKNAIKIFDDVLVIKFSEEE